MLLGAWWRNLLVVCFLQAMTKLSEQDFLSPIGGSSNWFHCLIDWFTRQPVPSYQAFTDEIQLWSIVYWGTQMIFCLWWLNSGILQVPSRAILSGSVALITVHKLYPLVWQSFTFFLSVVIGCSLRWLSTWRREWCLFPDWLQLCVLGHFVTICPGRKQLKHSRLEVNSSFRVCTFIFLNPLHAVTVWSVLQTHIARKLFAEETVSLLTDI